MCVYMCVNKYNLDTTHEYNQRQIIDATYSQGKLKLTRYIYWTSPLAKAKGNVWQGQPKKEPIRVYMCEQIQPTYNQGKLKLTRYIYGTSPLAKAKGNVWQSNNNPRI